MTHATLSKEEKEKLKTLFQMLEESDWKREDLVKKNSGDFEFVKIIGALVKGAHYMVKQYKKKEKDIRYEYNSNLEEVEKQIESIKGVIRKVNEETAKSVLRNEMRSLVGEKINLRNEKESLLEEINEDRDMVADIMNKLIDLENAYNKLNNNLAIQKGICPFPDSCHKRNSCAKDYCNHDECSNGYAFRRS